MRQAIENEERGTTVWTLEDVVLGKGVEEALAEFASFDRNRLESNLLDLAVRVFGRCA